MLFEIRAVMVVFSAFIGSIIVITVGWYNISLLDNDSRGMDVSLEALTCVVKKNFRVFFDDVWLSPNGKNSKNGIDIGCVTPDTNREIVMQNGSDLTMDEIVYAFELPPAINGTSEGFADWTDVAEGHLLLDIVFKKGIPKEVIPQLTFEVKLGFKDSDNPHANWTLHTQSMETRKLYCNTSASSLYENYKYGCNFLPFFKLLDIKHRHYLINLYFPIEIFPLHINSDINFIRTIKMVFIQYPTSYNKYIFFMRMILYPLSVGLSIWFIRRIGYKPIFLIERHLILLSINLVLMNLPLEYLEDFMVFPQTAFLYSLRQGMFVLELLIMWNVFCDQFFERDLGYCLFLNPWLILPLLISIPFILLEIFKSTSILHHPFFSIWNTFVGFYEFPLFNTVASFVVAVYCLSLIGRLFAIFHETVCTDKVYWQARGHRLCMGGATILRCVLFTVGTNIVVTLLTFLISQVNKLFVMKHSWNTPADFCSSTGIYCFTYLMWNLTISGLIIMYAPPKDVEMVEEKKEKLYIEDLEKY